MSGGLSKTKPASGGGNGVAGSGGTDNWTLLGTLADTTDEITGIASGYSELRFVMATMQGTSGSQGSYYLQLGDATAGGYPTSGSVCRCTNLDGNANSSTDTTQLTNGRFPFTPANHGMTQRLVGEVYLINTTGNRWVGIGRMANVTGATVPRSAGFLLLSGEVDRVRVLDDAASAFGTAAQIQVYAR